MQFPLSILLSLKNGEREGRQRGFVLMTFSNNPTNKFSNFFTGWIWMEGKGSALAIPHSLALIEDEVLCIADREHRRILCINAGLQNPQQFGQVWNGLDKNIDTSHDMISLYYGTPECMTCFTI